MKRRALVIPFLFIVAGCAKNEFGPVYTPAADHPAYARSYPDQLTTQTKLSEIEQSVAGEVPKKLETYPGELPETDWGKVAQVYELAGQDGKSEHYARVKEEHAKIASFFIDEKEELVRKISGGVHYQAKQEKCEAKFYGAIDRGFEKGVEERFDERQEQSSQAQLFISEHEEALGKQNTTTLREQATTISTAAYLAYVSLPKRHQRLKAMVEEADGVKKTLSKRKKELEEARSPGETPQEKEARNQERVQLEEALGNLEASVEKAKQRLLETEQQARDAQQAFEKALKSLLERVDR